MTAYDAVVVGAGPNGLAAAITLARAGLKVVVYEAAGTPGGGLRTEPLTRPGFLHDTFSAVHPLGAASPFFRRLPLSEHGLRWIDPPVALAHPLDDGSAGALLHDLDATCRALGADGDAYRALVGPLVRQWDALAVDALAPLHWPAHPFVLARFGLKALQSVERLVRQRLRTPAGRALFGAVAAHASVPPSGLASGAFGLVLVAACHRVGWPIPAGGSGRFAEALVSYLRSLGGEVVTSTPVRALSDLPPARATLLDVTPRQLLGIAGDALPNGYRRALERFRYGPGAFKVDWALAGPVPWRAAECRDAGTLHLGGAFEEVRASENATWRGEHPERPLVLVAQPSRFDPSRAPAGQETLWAYCHVPRGSTVDMTAQIEAQVERFAPGFRDLILDRHVMNTAALEAHNANLVGGDIGSGANTLGQVFFRPAVRRTPYATPVRGLYLCSASTPPGGGVHGLCGHHAARAALRDVFGITRDDG